MLEGPKPAPFNMYAILSLFINQVIFKEIKEEFEKEITQYSAGSIQQDIINILMPDLVRYWVISTRIVDRQVTKKTHLKLLTAGKAIGVRKPMGIKAAIFPRRFIIML